MPGESCIEMRDFPYAVKAHHYGCKAEEQKELLHSLLYTWEDPDTPDGMSCVLDFEGLKQWYDQEISAEEKEQYECPTIYEYLECELGRYIIPLKEVRE